MRIDMYRKWIVPIVLLTSLVLAASARAAGPWWQLSSSSRPGDIKPGSVTDQVERLTVAAASGTFVLLAEKEVEHAKQEEEGGIRSEALEAHVNVNATHQELQSILEGMYGSGNVEVRKGDGYGTEPYEVVFTGELADEEQESLAIGGALGEHAARLEVVTRGRADGQIVVNAENLGDGPVDGEDPVTIADKLPAGLEALKISAWRPIRGVVIAGPGHVVRIPCSLQTLSCTMSDGLPAYDGVEVRIAVRVRGALTGELNEATITGGGAPSASVARPITVSGEPTPFAVNDYRLGIEEEGGATDDQAGSHPFQVTGTVAINEGPDELPLDSEKNPQVEPADLAKDVVTKLPPGLFGNPTLFHTCSLGQFLTRIEEREDACPPETALGVASVSVDVPGLTQRIILTVPLFNLEPYAGEPARFGFYIPISETAVVLDTALRGTGEGALPGESEDHGIDVISHNITQAAGLISARVTFWGVPGDPRHSHQRGWGCLAQSLGVSQEAVELGYNAPCEPIEEQHPLAFLTTPTTCGAPLQTSVEVDPWDAAGVFQDYLPTEVLPALEGCNRLAFSPTFQAQPSTQRASAPTGLDVNIDFHDEGLTNGAGLVQSQLKDTTVTLPEGLTINPSAGVGLGGCTPQDLARETLTAPPGGGCPDDSKLGTVEVTTPLLSTPVHGSLYIAQPHDNPFDSLVALYVVLKDPQTGVLIKLAGKVTPNPLTGRLTTTFENNPQLPFSHFNFHFREGQQAPLISPPLCGTYGSQAQMTPWSEPSSVVSESSSFAITQGFDGGDCPQGGAPPFAPQIVSGMQNNNAGSFSPFYLRLGRTDAEQEISGFSTVLPPGLTGDLSGIPFCPEAAIAQARAKTGAQEEAQPSCPTASQIGHTLVGTGVGAVLAYVPGRLYLAGPYNGDPFSLVSVTSAVVGPFDLGTVVLRFGLRIDPHTAQVSVDPTASEPIPTIIDGIVTHVRDIRVYVDRPGFTLNPTSCEHMAIGSTLNSDLGRSVTTTSPYQAASCANLKFQPTFKVSTSSKTSRANGASLTVKLTFPKVPLGTEANISQVKVELPKRLPSRLTTLQKACTAQQFDTNPAGCPAASIVGHAKAVTPLIPVPLEGPAYFVSNGNESFPNLIMVLQGYGVTIDLVGDTFISKTGITSSTFKTVPDEPVGSFELTLPKGPYSALAANGNLCSGKLAMPTHFTAQNGVQIDQTTPITVTGCTKHALPRHARRLAAALKACHKQPKHRRAGCERQARRRYGAQRHSASAARGNSAHKQASRHRRFLQPSR
jgi:hypothetical protein